MVKDIDFGSAEKNRLFLGKRFYMCKRVELPHQRCATTRMLWQLVFSMFGILLSDVFLNKIDFIKLEQSFVGKKQKSAE